MGAGGGRNAVGNEVRRRATAVSMLEGSVSQGRDCGVQEVEVVTVWLMLLPLTLPVRASFDGQRTALCHRTEVKAVEIGCCLSSSVPTRSVLRT